MHLQIKTAGSYEVKARAVLENGTVLDIPGEKASGRHAHTLGRGIQSDSTADHPPTYLPPRCDCAGTRPLLIVPGPVDPTSALANLVDGSDIITAGENLVIRIESLDKFGNLVRIAAWLVQYFIYAVHLPAPVAFLTSSLNSADCC